MGNALGTEAAHLFFGQRRPLPKLDPHSHLLPKLGVGHAKDLRLLDSRMGVEKLLHFLGINVLTAANDHVLQAADDLHVAFLIHDREIAAVEPPRLIDGFPGAFIIAPVTPHDRVASAAQLPLRAKRNHPAVFINDLHLLMRTALADGGDPLFKGRINRRHVIHRARLRLPIADDDFSHVHVVVRPLHDLHRAQRAGHDPRAQGTHIKGRKLGRLEHAHKHGRHAVKRRAALVFYHPKDGLRLKGVVRQYRGGTMGEHPKHAHDHAKAVIKGHGNADPVLRRQVLPSPYLGAVVQNIKVGEGRALGITRGAAGELNIDGIIGAQRRREGGEPGALPFPTQGTDRGEVQHARRRALAEANDDFKLGKLCALEGSGAQCASSGASVSNMPR